jgi:hypothetical protein
LDIRQATAKKVAAMVKGTGNREVLVKELVKVAFVLLLRDN